MVISDVPGDELAAVASGPTLSDASTKADGRAVVDHFELDLLSAALEVLETGEETPKPGEIDTDVRNVATPAMALEAAAATARREGLAPLILGDALDGEARAVGTVMSGIARSMAAHGHPVAVPAVLPWAARRPSRSDTAPPGAAAGTPNSSSGSPSLSQAFPNVSPLVEFENSPVS